MSLWTPALTAAFEAAVVSPRVSLVVRPGDPAHAIVTGAAKALVGALPAVVRPITGAALDPLADVMARVSVTVPVPLLAPVIVLSSVAVADPVSEAATLLHELTHVVQIEAAGRAQAVADYTSGELRAQREADAAARGGGCATCSRASCPTPRASPTSTASTRATPRSRPPSAAATPPPSPIWPRVRTSSTSAPVAASTSSSRPAGCARTAWPTAST